MSTDGMSIGDAAKALGVSTRTVRRFIKSGKLEAKLFPGTFGPEYRIFDLPASLSRKDTVDTTLGQTPVQASVEVMAMLRELQEKNLALAAQLGAATERIRALESQVKLLGGGKRPWWKRLFGRA